MKTSFTNYCDPEPDKCDHGSARWKWNFLRPFFFSLVLALMFGNSAFAQIPSTCGSVNCTANDVKVLSVMITGKDGAPINCGTAQPFKDAELHLYFSSNAARMGVTLGATLKIPGFSDYVIAYCFSGQVLNDGTTDLTYVLPSSVTNTLSCSGGNYSLTNIYVAWGTGATKDDDFCGLSYDAKCPANKAKCYYAPNQVVSVPVLLAISFTYTVGTCSAGTSLNVVFTPTVNLQNIAYPLTYVWNFGDPVDPDDPSNPNILTLTQADGDPVPTASHTYSGAGTFNPSVTVIDANAPTPATASYSKSVTLGSCCESPVISTNPVGATYCQFTTTVSDLSVTATGANLHYQWYSNNTNSTTGGTPVGIDQSTYSPSTYDAGTTYYYVVVTGDCGNETSTVATITINPKATIQSQAPAAICSGGSVSLDATTFSGTNTIPAGTTYSWPAPSNPGITGLASGTDLTIFSTGILTNTTNVPITVTYVVTPKSGDCPGTSFKIDVRVNPTPTVTKPADQTVCNGDMTAVITFSSGVSGTTYSWTNDDASIGLATSGNGDIASFKAINTGSSSAVATIAVTPSANECLGTAVSLTITVNPSTQIGTQPFGATYCAGATANALSVVATGTGVLSYQWYRNTVNSTSNGTEITGAMSDSYLPSTVNGGATTIITYYYVIVTSPTCGSATSTAAAVTINPSTQISTQPTGATYCAGDPATKLTVTATGTPTLSYQWYSNSVSSTVGASPVGGNSNEYTPSTVNNGTTNLVTYYYVVVSSSACGSITSNIVAVTVKPLPKVDFSTSGTCASTQVIFTATGATPPALSANPYKWYVDGVLKSTVATLTVQNGVAGSSYKVKLVVEGANGCTNSKELAITVTACSQNTLTQGFYGSTTGKACPDNAFAVTILNAWLSPSGRTIGNAVTPVVLPNVYNATGRGKFTINSGEGSTLNGMMPGGSTPNRFNTTSTSVAYTTANIPKSNGKITNVLITQTITLGVNLGRSSGLANVTIEPAKYATVVRSATKCAIPTSCTGNAVTSSKMANVSTAFVNHINGKNIQYLYNLANDALGGAVLPTGVSYSDINNAVDFYNKLFDGGVLYLGNYASPYVCGVSSSVVSRNIEPTQIAEVKILSASASPNPFADKIRFTIQAPKAGRATLDVYNMLGQKIATPFQGQLAAGETRNVEYNSPVNSHANLIYMLRMNGEQVTGKVLNIKQ